MSNQRPILTAVALATAAIDGAWTRLMGVAGFLTGISQGAMQKVLGEGTSNREPTRMKKEEAFTALLKRQANRPERIDNDTPGAPTFFYCKICGALADVRVPVFPTQKSGRSLDLRYACFRPPADCLCQACCEMKKAGWLK